ncbi:MAG: hypothetical protein ACYCTV_02700 [Leptospirales bacterium]
MSGDAGHVLSGRDLEGVLPRFPSDPDLVRKDGETPGKDRCGLLRSTAIRTFPSAIVVICHPDGHSVIIDGSIPIHLIM